MKQYDLILKFVCKFDISSTCHLKDSFWCSPAHWKAKQKKVTHQMKCRWACQKRSTDSWVPVIDFVDTALNVCISTNIYVKNLTFFWSLRTLTEAFLMRMCTAVEAFHYYFSIRWCFFVPVIKGHNVSSARARQPTSIKRIYQATTVTWGENTVDCGVIKVETPMTDNLSISA